MGFLHDMFLSGALSAGVVLLIGGVLTLVIPIVARCTTDFFLLAFMNPHTIAFM